MPRSPGYLGLIAVVVWALVTGASYGDEADLALAASLQAAGSRTTSRVMVRIVERADRAALDYAAYDRNPLCHFPTGEPLQRPATVPALDGLDFGGAFERGSIVDLVGQTPLSAQELERPIAWPPLMKYLSEWDYDAAGPLLTAASRVSGEKWGNDTLVRPLQQVVTAYLHGDEVWVKVEFRPEVNWLPIDDEDGDGYREIYALLDRAAYAPQLLAQIRTDYLARTMAPEEIETYFFELASDWYQSLQTVTLEPEELRPWPNSETEPEIARLLGGESFARPFAVIRGQPYGEVIYNVFLLAGGAAAARTATAAADSREEGEATEQDWQAELQRWGGSWEAWCGLLADFQADVGRQLEARPAELKGLTGSDGFLFFRGDLRYLLSGDLRAQTAGRDPFPAIVDFKEQLASRNIAMLLAVIPTKAEVYPEKLSAQAPDGARPYVAPYCRKLLGELDAAGVEIVDLLPAFIAERDAGDELLYMPQDTHWTHRGVRLAAAIIARRVREYPWYAAVATPPVAYSTTEVTCTRLGDICAMLTDQEKLAYRPMKLQAQQVVAPDGALYVDDPASPIVMLGDSFTGVFHLEDCKHAGLAAHLARELGMPVDLIMAQGSGPRIRGQFARRGHDAIAAKRLVIWTVVSRDLHDYWAPWDPIKLP